MGKKLPYTPNSQIRAALRRLFLRSREHSQTLKDAGNCCSKCGKKKSVSKGREVSVHVHHVNDGISNWQEMFSAIRKFLLNREDLIVLCSDCHHEAHEDQSEEKEFD